MVGDSFNKKSSKERQLKMKEILTLILGVLVALTCCDSKRNHHVYGCTDSTAINYFLIILFFIPVFVFGQINQKCGEQHYLNNNIEFKKANQQTIEHIYNIVKTKKQSDTILKVPVVVHVVYENAQENIDDSLILSQIAVLNRDFRRLNSDTVNTRSVFDSLA